MNQHDVVVCRTGTANLASVVAGLQRAGATVRFAAEPDDISSARHVMVPGVGTFGAAMTKLEETAMVQPLKRRIESGLSTLMICVGMQLLFASSEESPGTRGLCLAVGDVTRYPDGVRVPQFGWNSVDPGPGCRVTTQGYAYFANSYRVQDPPSGWSTVQADHGGVFVAAMERGNVVACQFHPELSGPWGSALLQRWLNLEC